MQKHSQHAGNELIDEVFTVSENTTVGEGVSLLFETLEGAVELEGPEEVVGFLEVGAHGPDLVDEVLDAGDALLAEGLLDDGVVVEGDARAVHLTEATLVDQLAHGVARRVPVGDVGLCLLYTSPSPRDVEESRMPSSA